LRTQDNMNQTNAATVCFGGGLVNNHLCPYILEAEPGSCFTSTVSDTGEEQCEHIPACCPWYTCAQWQAPPLMSHCSSVDWSTPLAAALPSNWHLPAAASDPLQPVCIIQKSMRNSNRLICGVCITVRSETAALHDKLHTLFMGKEAVQS